MKHRKNVIQAFHHIHYTIIGRVEQNIVEQNLNYLQVNEPIKIEQIIK